MECVQKCYPTKFTLLFSYAFPRIAINVVSHSHSSQGYVILKSADSTFFGYKVGIVLCLERVLKIEKKTHCIYHKKRVSLRYGLSHVS